MESKAKLSLEKLKRAHDKTTAETLARLTKKFETARDKIVCQRLKEQGIPVGIMRKVWRWSCKNCGHSAHLDIETGEITVCNNDSCGRGCCDVCPCVNLSPVKD